MNKIEKWKKENRAYNFEGEYGVRKFCKLLDDVLDYRDNLMPQFSDGTSLGSLMAFLADNPGAIEALLEWIEEHEDRFDCPECGEQECECNEEDENEEDENEED